MAPAPAPAPARAPGGRRRGSAAPPAAPAPPLPRSHEAAPAVQIRPGRSRRMRREEPPVPRLGTGGSPRRLPPPLPQPRAGVSPGGARSRLGPARSAGRPAASPGRPESSGARGVSGGGWRAETARLGDAAPGMAAPGPRQRGQSCPCPGLRTRLPVLRWLPRYSLAWLQLDLIAGLTVGLTVVPQALAYAEVAGLPLQYGLYSSFMGCFVYCFLGTAKDVTLGPTAIMSLLVSSYAFHEPVYAILLAFLSGCIQLAMGLLHLGFLLDFISSPVIKGFTSAASITISFNQVKNILGLQGIPRQFFLQVYETLRRIGETRAGDAVLGLACLAALAGLRVMKSRLPRAAPAEPLAVRASYLIVWTSATGALAIPCPLSSRGHPSWGLVSLGQGRDSLKVVKPRWAGAETWRWVGEDKVPRMVLLLCMPLPKAWETSAAQVPPPAIPPAPPGSGQVFTVALSAAACNALVVLFAGLVAYSFQVMGSQPLTLTGSIPQGLPAFRLPRFSVAAPNGTVPFWSMVEDMGVGLAVVPLMGLLETVAIAKAFGFANILGSFVSSYPITGSFGRTAVNAQSGVCTPAGGLVTGTLVLLSLAYLTSLFYYIPKAALAAVIISAVVPMFDAGIFRTLWRVKRLDLVPLCVTFLLCFWEVQYGIVAGVLVSGILLLYSIARPPIKVSEGDALLVQPGSSLHFPAIEYLRDVVCSRALAAASPSRSIVLDCCHISSIDYTVVVGLAELQQELRKHGLSLAFCSLQDPVLQVLLSADLEGFQHFPSWEEAERCGGAEPGGSGAAPFASTSESSLLPAGLIQ
ncbi:sodium-independent sulfate anion transporter isoform X3 [Aquila chrysaetos chrysaetos]|uniref:sodium-independent sulfate anion transporter isoform X3 n=1 Tax=Aquila chrysaetos chrysaetos TaxID=223781 RepID=UPI001B7D3B7D|nr:sodium-independent sulfate anion transporter isoform X3 [Aquila chrysaetos chrysaetos]